MQRASRTERAQRRRAAAPGALPGAETAWFWSGSCGDPAPGTPASCPASRGRRRRSWRKSGGGLKLCPQEFRRICASMTARRRAEPPARSELSRPSDSMHRIRTWKQAKKLIAVRHYHPSTDLQSV